MRDRTTALARPPAHEQIPRCLGFAEITLKRVIPGDLVRSLSQIFLVLDVEADSLEGLTSLLNRAHLGDTVAQLDLVGKLLVRGVGGVPAVGHAPFVDTELGASC